MYKGSELLIVPIPRIRILEPSPGCPEAEVTVTPAARPFSALSTRNGFDFSRSASEIRAIAAVTTLFFCTPYPITTTSSSNSVSSSSTSSIKDFGVTVLRSEERRVGKEC